MTNKFTYNARQVVSGAILSAKELGHTYVGSEHLLLGITGLPDCTAAKLPGADNQPCGQGNENGRRRGYDAQVPQDTHEGEPYFA